MADEGVKYDDEKERMDLIPPLAIREIARVLTHGARKYDDDNWRRVKSLRRRYMAAALRHVREYQESLRYGEPGTIPLDDDSGLPSLAHAAVCLLFILEADEAGIDLPEVPAETPPESPGAEEHTPTLECADDCVEDAERRIAGEPEWIEDPAERGK